MICTVFVLRPVLTSHRILLENVLTSQCILLYPSCAYYKALVKDKGTLQVTGKVTRHWYVLLAFRPGTICIRYQGTFWYCTAQYASTGCNCMGSFVLMRGTFWYCTAQHASTGCNCMRSLWLQFHEIFCLKAATTAQ
jgi:hypothetical protein